MQREQREGLCEDERGDSGDDTRPTRNRKCRGPQREIETDLEAGQKGNRALRIIGGHAG